MGNNESIVNQASPVLKLPLQTNKTLQNKTNKNDFNSLYNLQLDELPFPLLSTKKNKQFSKVILASKNLMCDLIGQNTITDKLSLKKSEKTKVTQPLQEEQVQILQIGEPIARMLLEVSYRIKKRKMLNFDMITIDPKQFIIMKQTNIYQDYEFVKEIGRGSFGKVFKAIQKKTNEYRAIKKILKSKMNDEEKMNLFNQFQILKKLDHPNIIKLYQVYQSKENLYVVTQLCQGGNLLDMSNRNRVSEPIIRIIMIQLLSAVTYMHNDQLLHRDIKLQNIMLVQKYSEKHKNNLQIKLIDFGISIDFSKNQNSSLAEQLFGTLLYMSPESINGSTTLAWDIWSCGIICYMLTTKKIPYIFKNQEQLMDKVQRGEVLRKHLQPLSKKLKLFIMSLLEKAYKNRITAEKALKDLWLAGETHQNDVSKQNIKKAVNSLSHYHAKNNLVSMIQSYIVCKKINQAERQTLASLFGSIDLDKDGIIQVEELKKFYKEYSQHYDEQDVDFLVKEIDKNKSGKIDFNQFITAMCSHRKLFQLSSLQQAFDFFDKDSSGELSREQLRNILQGIKNEELEYLFKQVDSNQDSKISKTEFIQYFENQFVK